MFSPRGRPVGLNKNAMRVPKAKTPDALTSAFRASRGYFIAAALFSCGINVLYLASPIYMLQVYDRVLSSGSTTTLIMLTVALLMALATLAGLDLIRSRVLTRASVRLDRCLSAAVVEATAERGGSGATSQPLRSFDTFRQFVTGPGIHAVLDLPWAPLYIAVIFLLSPVLGAFALASALLLIGLAFVNEFLVREPLADANESAARNYAFTEMGLRNSEVIRAMGMVDGFLQRWGGDRRRVLKQQMTASDRAAAVSGLIRFLRLSMQSMILGLGAYLAIDRLITVGAIFAGSLLLGRALQPVEQMVGSWRNLVTARSAYRRVSELIAAKATEGEPLALPRPAGDLAVEGLSYAPRGNSALILRNVTFALGRGEVLGIVGPSGAGKSTLARALVGVISPMAGVVRLDGADVSKWPHRRLGRHLGYLPQDIELFADTVASNVGRFGAATDDEIVEAAQLAGVHEMILRLPEGYETQLGEGGAALSGGYRQRIGLARAVLGKPSLVVLDEPSSNLDTEGDAALADCISALKQNGTTVVIVSHRTATLAAVDKILLLRDGIVEAFGERSEVMMRFARVAASARPAAHPVAVASARGGAA